eukprot:6406645-Amphidinium_carterae.1
MGGGCQHVDRGPGVTDFKAKTNQQVLAELRMHSVRSQLRVRRLKWLKCIGQHVNDSACLVAALCAPVHGASPLLPSGHVRDEANPQLKQLDEDIQALATQVPALATAYANE